MVGAAYGTIPELLQVRAQQQPNARALCVAGETFTYAELEELAARAGGALQSAGVDAGARVAVMAPNSPLLIGVFLGCAWLGATMVPIDPARRGWSLQQVLAATHPDRVIATPATAPRLADHGPWVWQQNDWPTGPTVPPPGGLTGLDPAMVLFTSGATGAAKGVISPHSQFLHWGHNLADALAITPDDILFTTLSLHHTNALNSLAHAWTAGAQIIVEERFSARSYWSRVAGTGATVGYLLGSLTPRVLEYAGPASREHRMTRMLSPGLSRSDHQLLAERFGVIGVDGFGSTETNFVIGTHVSEVRPGWMGRVRAGFEIDVRPSHLTPASTSSEQAGELWVRSLIPGAMSLGYTGEPAPGPRDWRSTGDLVAMEDGWVRFLGRAKDVIRRNGENIQAGDVEEVLKLHPQVREAAVYAVLDAEQTEVMAAVVPVDTLGTVDPHRIDVQKLAQHAQRELPPYAVPRFFRVLDALPETGSGKTDKPLLRSWGISGDALDIAHLSRH